MRISLWLLPITVLLVVALPAAQQSTTKPAPRPSAVAQPSSFRPIATIKDLMNDIMIPASDVVFGAVGSTTTATGAVEERAPKNDEEWDVVRKNARLLIEGGNLLMMEGRHVASPSTKSAHPGTELEPAQIEALVARDRAGWVKQAQGIIEAGLIALKAVDAKNADALSEAGGDLDAACENCHMRYWYPSNTKP